MSYRRFIIICILIPIAYSCKKEEEEPCVYNKDVIDYYVEIANHFEYIDKDLPIFKWFQNPQIRVFGSPTQADLNKLEEVLSDINSLQDEIKISVTNSDLYEIALHFIRNDSFPTILPGVPSIYLGFAGITASFDHDITNAIVLIDTDQEQKFRNRTIREEITQTLGLLNDSYNDLYPNSIFNNQVNPLQVYDPIDELIIKMHYSAVIRPGMEIEEIRNLQCWE